MLNASIISLAGVGKKKADILQGEADINDVEDLLYYAPRRYIDRSSFKSIADCFVNETASVRGVITKSEIIARGKRRLVVTIDDGTDSLDGVFFAGLPYFSRIFTRGEEVIFSGTITFYSKKQMTHPEFDFIGEGEGTESALNTGRIVPLYKSTEKLRGAGLDSRGFRRIIKAALNAYLPDVTDSVPQSILAAHGLMPLGDALRAIHFPESFEEAETARRRLAFNEIFFLLFYLNVSKKYMEKHSGSPRSALCFSYEEAFIRSLPFTLTKDQLKAIEDIKGDLSRSVPMNRLLQGDVGSGKTVVAIATALLPAAAGRQAAFMAPTEILARQHFYLMEKFLPADVRAVLITGGMSKAEREAAYAATAEGGAHIVVGTHALLTEGLRFKDLAYIIIDEQHRFGVKQRAALRAKGERADFLIMTATPIPRTLAMTIFGDMDVSSIREKPASRLQVQTIALPESRIRGVYNSMEKYISQGRQAFYVLPLIEDSEKLSLKSAEAVYDNLRKNVFPHRRVALLHGRLKQTEKDAVMDAFAVGDIDILVSTTVIEVGIDVPNASVIVIEHAERFGLSQLHQLRGRVGRGAHQSFCVLLYPDSISAESKQRIDALVSTNDGFELAEADLLLRGAGELAGFRQHGTDGFEFADLAKDIGVITEARDEALRAAEGVADIESALEDLRLRGNSLAQGMRTKRVLAMIS